MAELYDAVPLSPLRKVIAARMSEAKRTIPHFRLVADMELDALLTSRAHANEGTDVKISVNDCLIKACATTLIAHPRINSQFVDSVEHRYRQADISIVVAVDGGLSTPVIRQADKKTVREIAAEAKDLATRAAAGQLKMAEITGGSFSISNLGGYDVEQFDAIINAPQCAILALGRAKPRPVVGTSRELRVATVLRATLSVDHRVIDGTTGAAFLSSLRQAVENPQAIFA